MFSTNPFLIQDFLLAGGPVLILILLATFLMWFFILERYLFYYAQHPNVRTPATTLPHWALQAIQKKAISNYEQKLQSRLTYIKTLIGITPLLGLLGTVTGMIEVFDSLNYFGSGNPRAMATGIAKATIPTMAGMTASISGIYFNHQLKKLASTRLTEFSKQIVPE